MNWKLVRIGVVGCAVMVMLMVPSVVYPCGPVFMSPVFVMPGPADDAKYAAGEIGIPLRSYGRTYVFIAYRYLSGVPLSKEEQEKVYAYQNRSGYQTFAAGYDTSENGEILKPWMDARKKITSEALAQPINSFKEMKDYQFFLNCPPPAFLMAAATLQDRAKKLSADELKDWVSAQDAVFSNCSGKAVNAIPHEAPASGSVLLKQDRAYQIAAASFYAGYFDNAIAGFQAIATDKQSPWHVWGKFLVGRSLIRKATLNVAREDEAFDPKVLQEAETELREVVADAELAPVHVAAQQMLGFTNFRLHPEEMQTRLASDLAKRTTPETMAREVGDYVKLLGNDGLERKDDMSDWIESFERFGTQAPDSEVGGVPSGAEVISSWKAKRTLQWLTLAMSAARTDDKGVKELIAEAEKVKSDSPAYATVRYHLARLAVERGDLAGVRKVTEGFLAQEGEKVPLSTKNMFLRLRLRAATDFPDFVMYAQRRPVATGADGFDDMTDVCKTGGRNSSCERLYLDPLAAKQLDWMPLKYWVEALKMLKPGSQLRQELALATWTRAVLAEDWAVANEAAREVETDVKGSGKYLDPFLQAADPAAKKFAASFAMLHWPGIQPTMETSNIRYEGFDQIDSYRQNWWCTPAKVKVPENPADDEIPKPVKTQYPAFLSAREQPLAQNTQSRILATESAPNYLIPIVVAWAKARPDDPRVPEALHLSVRAGHFGCTDERTTGFSKAAFQLLHARYPQSEWAKKTKYYY